MLGWQAYYHLEPWGGAADDFRTEYQLALHYSIHSKPGSKIPRFIDRNPQPKPEPKPEEVEESIRDFFIGRTVRMSANGEPLSGTENS